MFLLRSLAGLLAVCALMEQGNLIVRELFMRSLLRTFIIVEFDAHVIFSVRTQYTKEATFPEPPPPPLPPGL